MNKKYLIGILFITAITIGLLILKSQGKENQDGSRPSNLIPVDSITHGHGLAVDVADSNKLYIATHHGLLVLTNEKDLYRIGKNQDDFMGFSPHPTDPKVFFSSGHPKTGGNLGFQKSENGGLTWKKVSNGVNGPVDFHAMAVSQVNPNLVYGWYNGRLQKSLDGGNNWQIINANLGNVVSLASDPTSEDILYAATQQGVMTSKNKGEEWTSLSDELKDTVVTVIALNPQNSQKILAFSQKLGLAKSGDGGKTWEKVNGNFGQDIILYLAFDKQKAETIYALTRNNSLYKSTDEGSTWNKVR